MSLASAKWNAKLYRLRGVAAEPLELTIELGALGPEHHLADLLMLLERLLVELTVATFAGKEGLIDENLLALLQAYLPGQFSLKVTLLCLVQDNNWGRTRPLQIVHPYRQARLLHQGSVSSGRMVGTRRIQKLQIVKLGRELGPLLSPTHISLWTIPDVCGDSVIVSISFGSHRVLAVLLRGISRPCIELAALDHG